MVSIMADVKFTNNAEATLNSGITAAATTLNVKTGQGSMFPEITGGSGDYFMFALIDTSGNIEVCKCTSHAAGSTTFAVIERAQEDVAGTAAASTNQAFSADDKVELRVTAGILDDWQASFATAHTQNTDTGTDNTTFQLDSGNSGVKLKNNSGALDIRDAADAAWAGIKATFGTFTGAISASSAAIVGLISGGTLNISGTSTLATVNVSGAITARDHGTGTTDEVINVCYGTSATPPTASGTTEGAVYFRYIS